MTKPRKIMEPKEIERIRKQYTEILDKIFPDPSILINYQDKEKNKDKKVKNINPKLPASAIIHKAFALQYDADGNVIENREQAYIDAVSRFEDRIGAKPKRSGIEQALLTAISIIRALNSIESTQNRIKTIPDNDWLDPNMDIPSQYLNQLAGYRNQLKTGLKEHNKSLPDKFFIKEYPVIFNKIIIAIEDLMEFIRSKINKKASPANPHPETTHAPLTPLRDRGVQKRKSITNSESKPNQRPHPFTKH